MKRLKLLLISATLLGGMMVSKQSQAQNGPCGWTLNLELNQPTCYKVCDGSITVTPTVNWPDFEYLWSNGSDLSSISNLCEDEYTVTVTDDKKCSQTYTYSIIEPAAVVASCVTLTNETYPGAADGSIMASAVGGDGTYTFEWQTNPVTVGALLSNVGAGTYTVIVYDGNDCVASTSCEITVDKKEPCEGFRTQTQGGWGQCHQNGNNPGTYLFANFAAAFPGGLTIGCNRTLKLTSALAVCTFLPSGTQAKVLPVGQLLNPGTSYKNVFAGQLVTATLNVGFDLYDAGFGSSAYNLEDLLIASGTFQGWSVAELIAEADRKIGGCGSVYSPSQLSDALAMINENYVGGSIDNGFLVCPESKNQGKVVDLNELSVKVNIYPNPMNDVSNISIHTTRDEMLIVEMYNISGQKVSSLYKGEVKGGAFTDMVIDATSLTIGVYMVKVTTNTNVQIKKIVVNK